MRNYNHEDYIHFVKVYDDEGEHTFKEVPFEQIGYKKVGVPTINSSNVTLNHLGLDNYILKYWLPIMGDSSFALLKYLEMLAGRNDYICLPTKTLSKYMGKYPTTIKKNLSTLEVFGFILIVRRYDKLNNGGETSPYIRLLDTPLLSDEQVESLPSILKEEYKMFIKEKSTLPDNMPRWE